MSKENKDRDAIATRAREIASEDGRSAYLDQACGSDAELRGQVEERVKAHVQDSDKEKPDRVADDNAPSSEQDEASHTESHKPPMGQRLGGWTQKHPRLLTTAALMLPLLLIVAVAGVGLAVWERHKAGQARQAEKQADDKSKKAEKAETEAKGQLRLSKAARKTTIQERDRAREAEKAAHRSEEDTKAVLTFFKDKLLSAGRPTGKSISEAFWSGGQGKDVTLLKAVDGAEAKVADTFADRPLAEASVRELLGLAYLNLSEAAKAVKQYERALALREALLGADNPDTAASRNKLAIAYRLADRTGDAARLVDRNLNSPSHAAALAVRATMLLSQKKPAEAELKLRACLSIRQKIQPDDWTTFAAKALLGQALLEQKKYADAEPLLLSGYKGMKKCEDKIPSADKDRLAKTLEQLVKLYDDWDKKDKATEWRKELETTESSKEP